MLHWEVTREVEWAIPPVLLQLSMDHEMYDVRYEILGVKCAGWLPVLVAGCCPDINPNENLLRHVAPN
jgi:hypothetical protein